MTDLFSAAGLDDNAPQPLADRLRPKTLSDVIGQDHLIGADGPIGRMLANKRLASMILWGPPGVGKTTIAQLLAAGAGLEFDPISAIFSGVKDLRAAFDRAEKRRQIGKGTLLFVDEIHRFNKAQQDGFLPFVERGIVTLVGATTENPSFELNGALLSRCQVMVLKRLEDTALEKLLLRVEAETGEKLALSNEARASLKDMADGDGRYLLNLAEEVLSLGGVSPLNPDELAKLLQKRAPAYDKDRDEHYNMASALHKSVRGSDPDAALYWFCRMLEGGEDPLYLARRIVRMASEEVGLADPTALMIAGEAARTYERLGSPEGELALAHALVHITTSPKSNAVYAAYKLARKSAAQTGSLMPPKHILNAPTSMMKDLGYNEGYKYDHDQEGSFSGQNYFPDGMQRQSYYQPDGAGREASIRDRMQHWSKRRAELARQSEPKR
ncbi:replication-associated recombination protein A [Hirschia baltica]|uniref:Replication-associated recombination protein A n=1 Tax=Hirschia baltica (strain ATCC 49814 / DSM 5838 / IFAM 1418) TaxID=582402 RepID=C6XLE0_HIRBI|nr:replication-associated recombination protein A [Hirschia baltica]ACT59739.1 AAA ATPase central domain protein [Hirschia baltica ATCC 49814]